MKENSMGKQFLNKKYQAVKLIPVAMLIAVAGLYAQPSNPPTTGDAPCGDIPLNSVDTVVAAPDADGFTSLFNGTDFTGWWNSCETPHSNGSRDGAVFRVDPTRKMIYATRRDDVGGILMTKKKYDNYEIILDLWPNWGNDAGIFNRTTAQGSCYQTVVDYYPGGGLGGTWGENGYTSRDIRPFTGGNQEGQINISTDPNTGWTNFTAKQNPTSSGCPFTGCTQENYTDHWDIDGWNQLRIKFYGGLTSSSNIHMFSWIRKVGQTTWMPVSGDTTLNKATPAGYIGIQVHNGQRGVTNGNWYKNIKYRRLDDVGTATVSIRNQNFGSDKLPQEMLFNFRVTKNELIGYTHLDHELIVQDLNGKILSRYTGKAGNFNYSFVNNYAGVLLVTMKTKSGTQTFRTFRYEN